LDQKKLFFSQRIYYIIIVRVSSMFFVHKNLVKSINITTDVGQAGYSGGCGISQSEIVSS
jgi:hypothetical protein